MYQISSGFLLMTRAFCGQDCEDADGWAYGGAAAAVPGLAARAAAAPQGDHLAQAAQEERWGGRGHIGPREGARQIQAQRCLGQGEEQAQVGFSRTFFLRWKSQRIKIHRLAYWFSIDFLIHFFVEITKILQKSRDFCSADFLLEIFKIHRLVWIFLWFVVVLNLFHQYFYQI